jgi:hypothetical protein
MELCFSRVKGASRFLGLKLRNIEKRKEIKCTQAMFNLSNKINLTKTNK